LWDLAARLEAAPFQNVNKLHFSASCKARCHPESNNLAEFFRSLQTDRDHFGVRRREGYRTARLYSVV
jgi:hypothetical protein